MFYNLFIFEVIYRFFFCKNRGKNNYFQILYTKSEHILHFFFTFSRFFQFVLNEICSPKYIFSGFKSY